MSKLITARKGYKKPRNGPLFALGVDSIDNNIFDGGGISGLNAKIKGAKGATAAVGAGATLVGGLANKGISGGLQSNAGSLVSTLGGTAGSIVGLFNPIAGAAITVGSQVLGGLANRAFGMKTNTAALNAANEGTSYLNNFRSNASNFDEITGIQSVANVLNAYKGGWFSKGKARRKNAELRRQRDLALGWADRSIENNITNLLQDQMNNSLYNYAAFGGMFDSIDPTSPIGYAMKVDDLINYRLKNSDKGMTNMFAGSPSILAFGGNTESNGGTWSNGMTHVDVGGSHEENPNDGVLLGVDSEGTPNLVEEGEVIYDDYVFSNRLTVPKIEKRKDLSQEEKILKKYSGKTYANAAKKIEKDSGVAERPNDSIAKRGFEATLLVLATSLEREREKEKLQELQDAIDNMSPEELAALQQLMLAMQLLSEQLAAQQLMQLQEMSPEEVLQMQLAQQMQLMQGVGLPIAALGGILDEGNVFAKGGSTKEKRYNKFINKLGEYGLTIDDYINYAVAAKTHEDGYELTIDNFDEKEASKYLELVDKAQRQVNRKYKLQGLNPKHLTGAGLESYKRDMAAVIGGTSVADGDLSINNFKSNSSGDNKVADFNKYSYTRNTRQDLIEGGASDLKINKEGKFDVKYDVDNPTGFTYIEDMPEWNEDKGWVDKDGKVIEDAFGDNTKFLDVQGKGRNSAFKNQEELSNYYRDKLTDRFRLLKGANDFDENKLSSYYLTKDELNTWINGLEGSGDKKDQELASMLRANWNLDADELTESDSYKKYLLDVLKQNLDNNPQADGKPGIKHVPYLDAVPYSGKRYAELDEDGKPTGKYINWNSDTPLEGFSVSEKPISTDGGVTTYGVLRKNLASNVGVLPDGSYMEITPAQAAAYAEIKDTDKLPLYNAALPGYNHKAKYYDLSKDVKGNVIGAIDEGEGTDTFPKASNWPYWAAGIALLGALGYNIFSKPDYSNANAIIKAGMQAGQYMPVTYNPMGNLHVYRPDDPWFYTAPIIAQGNATQRAITNSISPSKWANTIANSYKTLLALGNATRQALEHNDEKEFKTKEANNSLYNNWSEGFLKADMANQDAFARAQGYSLEGQKAGYTMRQAIDDAKAAGINAGISGLVGLGTTYALNKYNQDVIRWLLEHNLYPISLMEDGRWKLKSGMKVDSNNYISAKGGKIKRNKKKGLNF